MNDMEQEKQTYILQLVIESPAVIEREDEWEKLFLEKPKLAGLKQTEVVLIADKKMAEKIAEVGVRTAVAHAGDSHNDLHI